MRVSGLVLVVVLFQALPAFADQGSVTLKEALRLALDGSHPVKGARLEREAAAEGVAVARSRFLPRISLDETFAASNAPTRVFMMKLDEGRFASSDFQINNLNHPATHADFRTGLTLEQPLFDLNIGTAVDLAKAGAAEKDHALEWRREGAAFRVVASYLEVQRSRATVESLEKSVADAREHLRQAKVRNEAGVGLKSDELRARTFLSETEQRYITAGNDLRLAKMRLALATGGKEGASLDISEPFSARPLRLGSDELLTLALEKRRDLRQVETEVEKAEVGVKSARNAWLPTVYATAGYQMNDRDIPFGRDNDAWQAGASLRWELFDGLRRGSDQARARALRGAAAEYLEQYRKEVALEVSESLLRREEAGKRLEVARHAYLDAEEGLRLVSRRFENSLATVVELLDAQTALDRARTSLIENETNYSLATARIYHTAGILLREVGQ